MSVVARLFCLTYTTYICRQARGSAGQTVISEVVVEGKMQRKATSVVLPSRPLPATTCSKILGNGSTPLRPKVRSRNSFSVRSPVCASLVSSIWSELWFAGCRCTYTPTTLLHRTWHFLAGKALVRCVATSCAENVAYNAEFLLRTSLTTRYLLLLLGSICCTAFRNLGHCGDALSGGLSCVESSRYRMAAVWSCRLPLVCLLQNPFTTQHF